MLGIRDEFVVYDSSEMDLTILIHTYISLNVSHQTWLAIMNYDYEVTLSDEKPVLVH